MVNLTKRKNNLVSNFRDYLLSITESKLSFKTTGSTGKPRVDKIIDSPEKHNAEVTVKDITPKRARELMAKGQGTTEKKAVARREKMPGFRENIDYLKGLIENGTPMNMPYVEMTSGGSVQDGFHRTIAAEELGIKKIIFALVKHKA